MKTVSGEPPTAATQLLRRFKDNVPLTPDELPVVREIGWEIRSVRRRQAILTEGSKNRAVYFVVDGFLIRYRILRDGQRQIVDLALPGDFAGVPSCFFMDALYTIKALTDATVAVVPLEKLVGLFETHPRLAAKIFWSFSCDAAIHAEHLIVVGRRSAHERIAHFLLELLTRLQAVGLADENSFELPLSQEIIGDALGLSLAYVNRTLRRLADERLVTMKDQKVTINDVEELAFMADFERSYLKPLPITEFGVANWSALAESRA
ncbi:MAG TPA: Crp/Fnr family transcriptional regulator [Stellaceae bacterium]|nr:Crp/Fnr family transcriptional regulator [Stellaceae bacterium]